MKMRNTIIGGVVGLILVGTIIVYFLLKPIPTPTEVGEGFGVVLDLTLPENFNEIGQTFKTGVAYLTLSENAESPQNVMNELFGQYTCFLENSTLENGKISSSFWVRASIPSSIRQDNAGENFCFYVYHHLWPTGGWGGYPAYSVWWEGEQYLGLENGDNFVFTLILPEGYEPRTDAAQLSHVGNKDNEFSIFTTATELTKVLEGGRWRVEAGWTMGEFDQFNTPFYLEVDYRKEPTTSPWGSITVGILVGAVIIALLAVLFYLKRVRK